jgi:hypothetical protein
MLVFCFFCFEKYAKTTTNVGARAAAYRVFKSKFAAILPKAERLVLLAMMATVGLIPFGFWTR